MLFYSFEDADIQETLKINVAKAQYDKPTPIQKWAIPVILAGRDLMGCAQTGSGKTVCTKVSFSEFYCNTCMMHGLSNLQFVAQETIE